MARVLISFLGTGALNRDLKAEGRYRTAKYKIDEKEYETSFIASALANHLKIEKFILIGTMKSMWDAVYEHFAANKLDENYYEELLKLAERADNKTMLESTIFEPLEVALGNNSKAIPIHYGLNQTEIDINLRNILSMEKYLENGDELFVDITHGFRSLSVFITTALMYLKDVSAKKLEVKGIFYGMLDITQEIGYAPIVRLDVLDNMMEWIKGAYAFKNFGNGFLIGELLKKQNNKIGDEVIDFSNAININYLYEIEQEVQNLAKLKFDDLSLTASLVVPQVIGQFVNRFKNANTQAKFQLELSDWHRKNRNYSSAFIVMVESILTYICEQQNWDWKNERNRNDAKNIALSDPTFRTIYGSANEIRNSIAHNVRKSNLNDIKSDLKKLGQWIDQLRKTYK